MEEHEELDVETLVDDAVEFFAPDNDQIPPPSPDARLRPITDRCRANHDRHRCMHGPALPTLRLLGAGRGAALILVRGVRMPAGWFASPAAAAP